jgi:hypothetical protein
MKTIKEIVSDYLEVNNLDGLFHEGDCSCLKDDLFCCDDPNDDCVAGKLINCEACSTYSRNHKRCRDGNAYCIGNENSVDKEHPDNHVENWEAIIELRPTLNPDPLDDRPYDWNVVVAIADDASFKFLRWGHLPDDFEDVDKPAMESEYSLDGSVAGVYRARVYYVGYGEDAYMEIDVEECLYGLESIDAK